MRDFVKQPLGKNERIPEEDLYYLYITLNKTTKEIGVITKRSIPSIEKSLKKYGIKKDLKTAQQNRADGVRKKISSSKDEILTKRRKTCIERYGFDIANKSQIVKDKIQKTCIEKYGTTCAIASKEIRKKGEKTCLERYGAEHYTSTIEGKQKVKNTNIQRYGLDYGKKIANTARNTMFEKYGVYSYSQTDEYKDKMANIYEKQGRSGPNQKYSDETFRILNNGEALKEFIHDTVPDNKELYINMYIYTVYMMSYYTV
jgi:hypothetical protein